MKILLLSMNFAPELTGVGKHSGQLADLLVSRGHEVTVVCAPPHYPQWKIQAGHSAWWYRVDRSVAGLTVWRCPVWLPAQMSGWKRVLSLLSFALSCMPVMVAGSLRRPQLVFAVAPALIAAPIAWISARLAGARCWLHLQDLEVDAAFELGLLRGRWARRVSIAFERLVLGGFDTVSTISMRMRRNLLAKGVPAERLEMIPNWVDLDLIRPTPEAPGLRESLGLRQDHIVCLYSGTMNRKQALGVLIEAARLLVDAPDIAFVLCGNGEMQDTLVRAAQGLPNVRFLDLQPDSALQGLLNMADIHLLTQLSGVASLVMPSKLGGMLASGRPVIASTEADSEIAAAVACCGLVVEPENPQAIADAVRKLALDDGLRRELGSSARAYAERSLHSEQVVQVLDYRLRAMPAAGLGASITSRRRG